MTVDKSSQLAIVAKDGIDGTRRMQIVGNGEIGIAGAVGAKQTVEFDGPGEHGTLTLLSVRQFAGTIKSFDAGDQIVLGDIEVKSVKFVHLTATLTLSDHSKFNMKFDTAFAFKDYHLKISDGSTIVTVSHQASGAEEAIQGDGGPDIIADHISNQDQFSFAPATGEQAGIEASPFDTSHAGTQSDLLF